MGLVAIVVGSLVAPQLAALDQAFQYIQEYTGFISPGVLAIFLLAFLALIFRVYSGGVKNFWIIAATGSILVVLGISAGEWRAVILAIALVWTAEALNTALELLCDVASPEFHPLIQKGKDIAAAAVLLSSIGAAVIGLLVFGPRLLHTLG